MKSDDFLLKVYCMRHQESEQNNQGYGMHDTNLTPRGVQAARDLGLMFTHPRAPLFDRVIRGTLQRHRQTYETMNEKRKFAGFLDLDDRLNALAGGPLVEQPADVTTNMYNLARFAPGADGLYHATDAKGDFTFNPNTTKVFPFHPLYCQAYFDKRLRNLVFPGTEHGMPSFETIEGKTGAFQRDLIARALEADEPLNILTIGSCGPNAMNLEYAAHGTVGEHAYEPFGSEGNPIMPQNHDQLMVLGYTRQDAEEDRKNLRAIEGNVSIARYLDSFK